MSWDGTMASMHGAIELSALALGGVVKGLRDATVGAVIITYAMFFLGGSFL